VDQNVVLPSLGTFKNVSYGHGSTGLSMV